MNTSKLLLSLPLIIGLSACSTITTGTTQSLTVETPFADGAKCSLVDTKGSTWRVTQTPQTVEVNKGDGPMTITCTKSDYQRGTTVLEEGFAGMTLGNAILGGGVGLIVDAASGAAQEYPDSVSVWMQPNKWKSSAQKAEWEAAKAAHDAEMEAKKNPSRNEEPAVKSTGNFNKK